MDDEKRESNLEGNGKPEVSQAARTSHGGDTESTLSNPRHELPTGEPSSEETQSSPNEPELPPPYTTFTQWEKRLIVFGASMSAFFSPLTAQIYLPALPSLAQDFNVSISQINLTVTTYMIFQGVTPMFVGGFADTAGRRPAYVICFVVYIAANIGLALSKTYASVMVVRCLQSAGSSTTVALAQAVVADIITSAERGQYVGITVLPIVLAPSLGPVIGGLLSQYLGWRWIFWLLTILAAVNLGLLLLFFPETCREIVGDGSIRPHTVYLTGWQMIKDWRRHRTARKARTQAASEGDLQRTTSGATSTTPKAKFRLTPPDLLGSIKILAQKEMAVVLGYGGIVFAGFYAVATAMPSQLAANYGFNDIQVGLMYIPMAGGSIVAALFAGRFINRNYARHATKLGIPVDKTRQQDLTNFPIEKARLEVGLPLLGLATAVTLSWGWALQYRAHLAVPIVLLFLLGFGMIGMNNTLSILLVDINRKRAGAAVAANNLTRCLIGAAASAVITPLINAWGAGWAFTFIAALYVLFSPLLWLSMTKGIQWRAEEAAKQQAKAKKAADKKLARKGGVQEGTGDEAPVTEGTGGVVEEEKADAEPHQVVDTVDEEVRA